MKLSLQAETFCRQNGFLPTAGQCVLCAVSGGVDSMVLLRLLHEWSESRGFTLLCATYDHRLRPTSGEEGDFVEGWCREHAIPCHRGAGDVAQYARQNGLTIEEAAREMRYAFLTAVAEQAGCDCIATAHNADDNAETLLLHLLRGSGCNGLGGIPPRRGKIIRPLLSCTREDILRYAREHAVPYREDESNRDIRYTRNYLRHEVMPLLKAQNPALIQTLSRTAQSLRRDEDFFRSYTEKQAEALLTRAGDGWSIPCSALLAQSEAIVCRLLQEMAQRCREEAVLPQNQRQALLELAKNTEGTQSLSLCDGLEGVRAYEKLIVRPKMGEQRPLSPCLLVPGGSVILPWGEELTCREAVCPEKKEAESLYVRPGWEKMGLTVRSRQTGDRLGLRGRVEKSLKKWLIEEKVPQPLRDRIPVLTAGDTLVGAVGIGCQENWDALPGETCWQITIKKATTD